MKYYLYHQEKNVGPIGGDEVRQLLARNEINPGTPCCQEGDSEWKTVQNFIEMGTTPPLPEAPRSPSGLFGQGRYLLRKKFLSFLGASFQVFDASGAQVFFSKQKAFKLREDIRVYRDESMSEEVLLIRARQILDFSAAYEVVDAARNEVVGILRRKGFSSLLRDAWQVLDASEREIGQMAEDNMLLALIRRFLMNLVPQKFHITVEGRVVAEFSQRFNPFIYKMDMDFTRDTTGALDRRLGVAAAILLAAIEGRQD